MRIRTVPTPAAVISRPPSPLTSTPSVAPAGLAPSQLTTGASAVASVPVAPRRATPIHTLSASPAVTATPAVTASSAVAKPSAALPAASTPGPAPATPAHAPATSPVAGVIRNDREIVRAVVARLRAEIGEDRFQRYFTIESALRFGEGCLDVCVASTHLAQAYDRHFGDILRTACRAETGSDRVAVRFIVREGGVAGGPSALAAAAAAGTTTADAPAARRPAGPVHAAAQRRAPVRQAEPARALIELVRSEANEQAIRTAQAIAAADPALRGVAVIIHGQCGVGKTHLLTAAVAERKAAARDHSGNTARYVSAEQFVNDFVIAAQTGKMEQFRRTYRSPDLLCVDDLHILENKTKSQQEFQATLDAILQRKGCVILATSVPLDKLTTLPPALRSRLAAAVSAVMAPPGPAHTQRVALALASRRGLRMGEAAAQALAQSAEQVNARTPRDIEGLIARVDAFHRLIAGAQPGVPVNPLTVRRALGLEAAPAPLHPLPTLPPTDLRANPVSATSPSAPAEPARPLGMPRPVRAEEIIHAVCVTLGVGDAEFRGRGRHWKVVLARSVASVLSKRLTRMSFPEIARAMGRPNHSTIITACQRLEAQMAQGARVALDGAEIPITELCDRLAVVLADRARLRC